MEITGYLCALRRSRNRGAIVPFQRRPIPARYMLNYSTGTTFRLLNVRVGLCVHKYIRVCYLYV